MDRIHIVEHSPLFELAAIRHGLSDLAPGEEEVPRAGRTEALLFTAIALIALLAFVGWLLVG
jgi:hypothetical protein